MFKLINQWYYVVKEFWRTPAKVYRLCIWFALMKINMRIANHWLTEWNKWRQYGFYEEK